MHGKLAIGQKMDVMISMQERIPSELRRVVQPTDERESTVDWVCGDDRSRTRPRCISRGMISQTNAVNDVASDMVHAT